ncbi:LysR family transcriptional regulator [Desulfitobacterium sp. AusDCA]|uniref:LysR family transcriptional regulator n=1 Tax=Desulfitobacterium sp. AusDCA TaxID=3240383 RepID=UPI003DA7A44B
MRIDDLRYLVAIAEFGSISKASKHLFISQQGLSQAIQQLEKSLNVVLLTRNGNRIYFTEIGEKFVQSAREILAKHDELLNMIKPFPDDESTKTNEEIITVYSTAFLCLTIIPELLHYYQQKHPNLNLHIVEKRPSEILSIIANDKNAIGLFNTPDFKFKPQIFKENNLTFEKLMKCEQMLCVSRSSPFAAKESVTVDDIAKCKFAIFDFEQEVDIVNYIFTNIQQPNIILKTTNQKLYMDMIINGFAVGFTNTFISNFLEKNTFSTIPFDPPINIYMGLLLNANQNFTSNTEIFLNSFRKFVIKLKERCRI